MERPIAAAAQNIVTELVSNASSLATRPPIELTVERQATAFTSNLLASAGPLHRTPDDDGG
jgi:hypothetical protein